MKSFMFLLVVLLANRSKADILKDQCKGVYFDVVPYPGEMHSFIICAYEVPEMRTCPSNTCFDAALKSCTVSACNPVKPSDLEVATQYCKSHTMEKIPSADCAHFWICLDTVEPVYMACPKGNHFSRSAQECISPALAQCMAPEKLCANGAAKTYQAENCNEYYACANNNLLKFSCPYGQAYSVQTDSCATDVGHTCISNTKPNCRDSANVNTYFSHSDCNKFYVCIQSETYEGKCADGHAFDSKSSSCKKGNCQVNKIY